MANIGIANIESLTDIQRDALREVANIGAGHAATALSLMTGAKIMISVPTLSVAPLEALAPVIARGDEVIAVVPMVMNGSLHGHTILAFPLRTAHWLASLMLRRRLPDAVDLSELESSALKEAGNIIAGAYMTALSEFLSMSLMPSPPSLVVGPARAVFASTDVGFGTAGEYVLCVETQFVLDDSGHSLPAYFLLLPDGASLGTMLSAVRVG